MVSGSWNNGWALGETESISKGKGKGRSGRREVKIDLASNGRGAGVFTTINGKRVEIREVWAENLEEEMANIREVVEDFPYIAMVHLLKCGSE